MTIHSRLRVAGAAFISVCLVSSSAGVVYAKPPPRSPETHFNFIRLPVADLDRSIAFYMNVVGLHERGRLNPSKGMVETFFGYDDNPMLTALNLTHRDGATAAETAPSTATLCFVVPDVAAAVSRAAASSGKVIQPARRIEVEGAGLTVAFVDDPGGNHLELLHYEKIADAPK